MTTGIRISPHYWFCQRFIPGKKRKYADDLCRQQPLANYGTEWEQYFDYINLMSYDRGAFTDKPVQHASYDDFVKDLKYWNEQCRAAKSKIVGGLPFLWIFLGGKSARRSGCRSWNPL